MKIVHVRSKGEVKAGEYFKMMNMFLAAESDELQRCMRLSIETENVGPIKFLSYEKEKNSLQTEYVVGDSFFNKLWNETTFLNLFYGSVTERKNFCFESKRLGTG